MIIKQTYLQNKTQEGGIILSGIIFFTTLVFLIVNVGLITPNSVTNQYLNGNLGIISGIINTQGGLTAIITALGLVISAVSLLFPNPYTLFGGIFTAILGIVIGISNDVFGLVFSIFGSNSGFQFITIIMSIIFVLSLIDWFRQGRQL